jgi:hypothetical protein
MPGAGRRDNAGHHKLRGLPAIPHRIASQATMADLTNVRQIIRRTLIPRGK